MTLATCICGEEYEVYPMCVYQLRCPKCIQAEAAMNTNHNED